MTKKKNKGFSLLELLVTLVIVSILAAVAVPSYKAYTLKAQRTDAISNLLQAQSAFENYFAANNSFPTSSTNPTANSLLPANTTSYNFSVSATASSYTLTATAIAAQTSDSSGGVSCATLTINYAGVMSPVNCWNR